MDILKPIPAPTHPSDTVEWYDDIDPLPSDMSEVWVSDDGTVHLTDETDISHPPEYSAELAARLASNEKREQEALAYLTRKMTVPERLCINASSHNARQRLAALRALRVEAAAAAEEEEKAYQARCEERKRSTRKSYMRKRERDAQIKLLRHEMFKCGYYWDGYMSKQEAAAVLDRCARVYVRARMCGCGCRCVSVRSGAAEGVGGRRCRRGGCKVCWA